MTYEYKTDIIRPGECELVMLNQNGLTGWEAWHKDGDKVYFRREVKAG